MIKNSKLKVALVYDRVNKFGGAERVLLTLHEIFPDAPLYTSVYNPESAPWASVFDVRPSFLQKLPLPKDKHEYYPYLMGPAFETFDFDGFDLVISVTHEFAKAVITKPKTLHICYCLNPVGYLWSGYEAYFYGKPAWFTNVTYPLIKYLRWYDKIICHRPDAYITISQAVKSRIKKYYGLESTVIYPPVKLAGSDQPTLKAGGDYLVVSRLVPEKRVDIAVSAFNELGLPLKIIGKGGELESLKKMAKSNVEFLGYLTDSEVASYYKNCRAVIICGEEDFNIVAVEAQSYGKPVIAFRSGGVTETVIGNKTGYFFDHQSAESLTELIKVVTCEKINPDDCIESAKRFSKERFKKELLDYVRNY